jgi:hypothetical protein
VTSKLLILFDLGVLFLFTNFWIREKKQGLFLTQRTNPRSLSGIHGSLWNSFTLLVIVVLATVSLCHHAIYFRNIDRVTEIGHPTKAVSEFPNCLFRSPIRPSPDSFGWKRSTNKITQILTGHCLLNAHQHRFGFVEDPSCSCGEPLESLPHFLFFCPTYNVIRKVFRDIALEVYNIWPPELSMIPRSEALWRAMKSFVVNSKRIDTYSQLRKWNFGVKGDCGSHYLFSSMAMPVASLWGFEGSTIPEKVQEGWLRLAGSSHEPSPEYSRPTGPVSPKILHVSNVTRIFYSYHVYTILLYSCYWLSEYTAATLCFSSMHH